MRDIKVTQQDIDGARIHNPIELAIIRELKHSAQVGWAHLVKNFYSRPMGKVAYCDVYYDNFTREYDIFGGSRAAQFLIDWQDGKPVTPQTFQLEFIRDRAKRG